MKNLIETLKMTLLFLGLFVSAQTALGQVQEKESLSLDDCRELVLLNNEDAIIASAEVRAKEEEIKERKTHFLPSISASSSGSGFTDNPVLPSFARHSAISDVSIEQTIYNGGKLKSELNLAKIEKQISETEKEHTDEQLLYHMEQLYWRVVATGQQVVVAEQYLKTLGDLETKIADYLDSGLVNRTDLLETQVEKNRAQYDLEVAKNAKNLAKLQLAYAIGKEDVAFEIEGTFDSPMDIYDYITDRETSFAHRPELDLLRNSLLAKNEEEQIIMADYRPKLDLSLGSYYYAGEETIPGEIETDQAFGEASIHLHVPIFHWGQKKHRLKRNKIEKEQLVWSQSRTKKLISVEVQQAIDKIEEAKINVELSQKSRSKAQENARITNDNYIAGIVTSEEVLEAEALYQKSQLDYINARVQEQLSHSYYLKTLGKLAN